MIGILIILGIGFLLLKPGALSSIALSPAGISPTAGVPIPVKKTLVTYQKTPAPSPLTSPAIQGMIGVGINQASSFITGNLAVPSISSFLGGGQGDFSQPYSGIAESTINSCFPVLGTVIGGFLEGILGKDPQGTYIPAMIYDSSTRSFKKGAFLTNPYLDNLGYYLGVLLGQIKEAIQFSIIKQKYPNAKNINEFVIYLTPQTEFDYSGSVWTDEVQKLFESKGLGFITSGTYRDFYEINDPAVGYRQYMNSEERDFYVNVFLPFLNPGGIGIESGWISNPVFS